MRSFPTSFLTGLCALVLSGLMVGAAVASPAETIRTAVMRAAPSARARVVQVIPPHAEIELESCGRHWCLAIWRGIDGYVSARSVINLAQESPPVIYGEPYDWDSYYNYAWGPYYGFVLGRGVYSGPYGHGHFRGAVPSFHGPGLPRGGRHGNGVIIYRGRH